MKILAKSPTVKIFENNNPSKWFYQESIECIKHSRHNLLNQGLSDRALSMPMICT